MIGIDLSKNPLINKARRHYKKKSNDIMYNKKSLVVLKKNVH